MITAKANSRVGIIKRNFSVLSKEILVPLYLSLVCPILDYGAQSWSPNLIRDIQPLKQVQRRTTKLVGPAALREECQCLDLHTLQDRRIRGNMIKSYKLVHHFEDIPYTCFFQLNTIRLRGHSLKLLKPDHWRTTLKGNWFSIRVMNHWNALPESVVTALTIATFKARYDRHIKTPKHTGWRTPQETYFLTPHYIFIGKHSYPHHTYSSPPPLHFSPLNSFIHVIFYQNMQYNFSLPYCHSRKMP